MELKKVNQIKFLDVFESSADLKKYVFINLRKQIRQKMEGLCASKF